MHQDLHEVNKKQTVKTVFSVQMGLLNMIFIVLHEW